jgi:HipA-like protein
VTRKQMAETVAAFRRVLARGSSFPSLIETSSGRLMVMKLSGAGQGARGLATELIAVTLAGLGGLNVPRTQPLLLPDDLPWQVGTDEFYDAVQRSAGWNLGVEFIPDATDLEAADLPSLPAEFLSRLAAVDALLQNVDRTTANPNVLRDAVGTPWAIDFGACLLIDRLVRGAVTPRLDLPANHILAGGTPLAILPQELAASIGGEQLDTALAEVPEAWLTDVEISRRDLADRLKAYFRTIRGA